MAAGGGGYVGDAMAAAMVLMTMMTTTTMVALRTLKTETTNVGDAGVTDGWRAGVGLHCRALMLVVCAGRCSVW